MGAALLYCPKRASVGAVTAAGSRSFFHDFGCFDVIALVIAKDGCVLNLEQL